MGSMAYPTGVRRRAAALFREGLGYRRAARRLCVPPSVTREWVRSYWAVGEEKKERDMMNDDYDGVDFSAAGNQDNRNGYNDNDRGNHGDNAWPGGQADAADDYGFGADNTYHSSPRSPGSGEIRVEWDTAWGKSGKVSREPSAKTNARLFQALNALGVFDTIGDPRAFGTDASSRFSQTGADPNAAYSDASYSSVVPDADPDAIVYPYEAYWLSKARSRMAAKNSKPGGWFVIIVAVILGIVLISNVADALPRKIQELRSSAGHLTEYQVGMLIVDGCLGVALIGSVALAIHSAVKKNREVKRWEENDAHEAPVTVMCPDRATVTRHQSECLGDAYPMAEDDGSLPDSRLAPAWAVVGAGPLRALPGVIVDTLSLASWVNLGNDVNDKYDFNTHYVLIELTDEGNRPKRVWSDAVFGWFQPGQRVTAYCYDVTLDGEEPFLRVHDVADASQPVNVAAHAGLVFSAGLAEYRDRMNTPIPDNPAISNSYCTAHDDEPWHKSLEYINDIGYCAERRGGGEPWGTKPGRHVTRREPQNDFLVRDSMLTVSEREWKISTGWKSYSAVVDAVVVTPLFNRRFWCGYGYAAKVRFTRYGKEQNVWAFCDPSRDDSYLGSDDRSLRPIPLHVGDSATVWRDGHGACVVVPLL